MPLLQAMVIMSEFDGLAYPPNKSPFLMQTFVKVLAPIGRLLEIMHARACASRLICVNAINATMPE
jgi:hypothetical protein